MELGGLFGSLLAGRISDALIAKNPKGGNVGKRVQASSILMNDFPCPLTVAHASVPFHECSLAARASFIEHLSSLDDLCMPCLFVPLQVVIGYTVGVAAMLLAFWSVPATLPWLQWATVFMIGFFLYGPQMLIGLCGAELVGPESVGASEGFLGWIAYLGEPT